MLKSFFASDEEPESIEYTGIEWLDIAIKLALYLIKEHREETDGRLAEFGNAAVLKTDDTET